MRWQSQGPATHSPNIKSPNLALPPNPNVLSVRDPGAQRRYSREEPQGGDAEHGLLSHVAGQLLTSLFEDQRLEGPERYKNSPQRARLAAGLEPAPLTPAGPPHLDFLGQKGFGKVIIHRAIRLGMDGTTQGVHRPQELQLVQVGLGQNTHSCP